MDSILAFLSSGGVVVFIAGVMVIAFAKSIIKIFKMGAMWKTEFASRKEQKEFETEMRKDMRAYATQIQKAVIESVMVIIDDKFKDIEDSKEIYTQTKVMKAELEVELKQALEKLDSIKGLEDSVRALKNKVDRLEYKDSSNPTALSAERRKI